MIAPLPQREAFLNQYRHVRERDGYRTGSPAYYRALPWTAGDDPQHQIWSVRQRSFERFRQMVLARFRGRTPVILDLGAGNGWLSYRMTLDGCAAVAVDINRDDRDGLGAAQHYNVPFARVQADFDALPFARRSCDVVVFNGSLHYAPDVRATLERAAALIAPGGVMAVIDSPMFECPHDGQAMRERTIQRFRRDYGVPQPVMPGDGFLLFSALEETARPLGFDTYFFESQGDVKWTLGKWAARIWRGSSPASFGVWWAAAGTPGGEA